MAELASQEDIAAFRRPAKIYTTAYLNDPIFFDTDNRLTPETLLSQVQDFAVIERDFAQFTMVNLSATGSQYYPIAMHRVQVDRVDYLRHIKREFTQLI